MLHKTRKWVLLTVGLTAAYMSYGQRTTYDDRDDRANRRSGSRYSEQIERDLIDAYKKGYEDGWQDARRENRQTTQQNNERNDQASDNVRNARQSSDRKETRLRRPYQAFTGGFYVGANSTRYRGEDVDGKDLTGRLGYQLGVFVRGGGRIYGQIGAEYFTSSSNFFRPGDGQDLDDIAGRIDTRWLQIPAYLGVKLAQSKRGISSVRMAVGAEYANRLNNSTNTVDIDQNEIRSGTFLALGNIGFDLGPLVIDLVYHHGLNDAIKNFNNSQRRSLGVNVGFKF